jgi:hypothetical protein
MLARRLGPPEDGGPTQDGRDAQQPAVDRAQGRWRTAGRQPTRGPRGEVVWWERPAPGGDVLLWQAVCRAQERRIATGVSVTALAGWLALVGHPVRRETLSRVLNGVQPTSWSTVEVLAHVLEVDLSDLHEQRFGGGGLDTCGGAEIHRLPGGQ